MNQSTEARGDRAYYAQRAAEELELALAATDKDAAAVHRRLQRAYLEKASVGERSSDRPDQIG